MVMSLVVCLAFLLSLVQSETPLTWTSYDVSSTRPAPIPRREAMAEYDAVRNQIILFGGRTLDENGETDEIFDDTWVLDLRTVTWRELDTIRRPVPTYAGTSGVIQSQPSVGLQGWFVVATGHVDGDTRTEAVWVFNLEATSPTASPTSVAWHRLPTYGDIPRPRYGAAGSVFKNILYLSHGYNFVRFSDSYELDLNGLVINGPTGECKWTKIGGGNTEYDPNRPHPRFWPASTVSDAGQLVMFGGCLSGGEYGGPCPSRDGWVYHTELDQWTWTSDGPGQSFLGKMVPIGDDEVLLWGGSHWSGQLISSDEPNPLEVHVLRAESGDWRRYVAVAKDGNDEHVPEIRVGPVMVSLRPKHGGEVVIMWGGYGLNNNSANDKIYVLAGNLTETEEIELGWSWWTFWHLHGLFMIMSMGIMVQLGVCFERYAKTSSMGALGHKACNGCGAFFAILGIIFGFVSAGAVVFNVNFAHSVIGIVLFILIIFQPIIGVLRFGEGTAAGSCWSIVHRSIGWFIALLSLFNIVLGLVMALLNRLAYAFIAYILLLLLLHLLLTLFGFNKIGKGAGAQDFAPMDDGVFKTSEVFKAGTKGGSSALYTNM